MKTLCEKEQFLILQQCFQKSSAAVAPGSACMRARDSKVECNNIYPDVTLTLSLI